jgi:hypothetical protein
MVVSRDTEQGGQIKTSQSSVSPTNAVIHDPRRRHKKLPFINADPKISERIGE